MKFRKTTAKTVSADLRAFAAWLDSDSAQPFDRKSSAACLNEWLDELYGEDAFGTEGQADPRGDHRD